MFKPLVSTSVLGARTFTAFARASSLASRATPAAAVPPVPLSPDLQALKFDSNASNDLYAICKIHNIPYLVTKGDRLILPYKMRNLNVGDVLRLDNVTTLGSRNFTFTNSQGIPLLAFSLTATLTEITREPKYFVQKKRQRCRRIKTVEVEPFQTHLTISELRIH